MKNLFSALGLPAHPDAAAGRKHGARARRAWHLDLMLAPPLPATPEQAAQDAAADCGWFDSSWTLASGCQVTEHAQLDPVARHLPLAWWLEGPGAACK